MQIALIEGVILLVGLVVLSNIISHYLVDVPISLIQIAVGLVLALLQRRGELPQAPIVGT